MINKKFIKIFFFLIINIKNYQKKQLNKFNKNKSDKNPPKQIKNRT